MVLQFFFIQVSWRMQKIKVKNFSTTFNDIFCETFIEQNKKRKHKNLFKYLSAFGYFVCYFVDVFVFVFFFLIFVRWNIKGKNPSFICLLFWHKRHTIAETNNKQGGNDANCWHPNRHTKKRLQSCYTVDLHDNKWRNESRLNLIWSFKQSKVIKYNADTFFYMLNNKKQKNENHFQ